MQAARTSVPTRSIPFPKIGTEKIEAQGEKSAEEMYADNDSDKEEEVEALNPKSDLQAIVSATLEGTSLNRPTVIFFHTSDMGLNPKKPARAYQNSRSAFGLFQGQAQDVNLSMALHFAFDVKTSDVGEKIDDKDLIFRKVNYAKVPAFAIVDTEGVVLASTGGGGKVSAAQLMSALNKASKALGYSLSKKIKKQQLILREMVQTNGNIRGLQTSLGSLPEGQARRGVQKRIDRLQENLQDLKEEETELWADISGAATS